MSDKPPFDRQNLIDLLVKDLRPVKVATYAGVFAKCLAAIFGILALASVVFGVRPDLPAKMGDAAYLILTFGAVACFLMSLAGVISLSLPAHSETFSRHLVWFGAIPFLLGLMAMGSAQKAGFSHDVLTARDAQCGAVLIGLAVVPFLIFTAQFSQLAPFRFARVAFGIGASALSVGTIFLQWHCSSDNGFHLAVWHFLPVVPIAVFLALTTRGFFKRWQ